MTTIFNFFTLFFNALLLVSCSSEKNVILNATYIPRSEGYINVNKGKIYYQTFGKGKAIIVLNGGPGRSYNYLLPQMLKLAKKYQVTFYDQRGCGKSFETPMNNKFINMDQYVEDLECIRKKLGYSKVVLLAHSWGGLLAINYAVRYSQNLSHLILSNSIPLSSLGFQEFINEYRRRMKPLRTKIKKIKSSKSFKVGDPKVMEEFQRLVISKYFANKENIHKFSIHFTRQEVINLRKIRSLLTKNYLSKQYSFNKHFPCHFKVPTLIIHGKEDIVPLKTVEYTREILPNAMVLVYENCDHFPFIESSKNFFNDICEFLNYDS